MKKLISPALLLMLAACGKDGAERYVGYWQEKNDKHAVVSEIKQENGNYFAVANVIDTGKNAEKQIVLSEKEGELVVNYGVADMPLKLSDDGKSMFMGKKSFQKIDAATKDKIMAHEERCRQLTNEFQAAEKQLPKTADNEYRIAKDALKQKYFPQFEQLEQEIPCNTLPVRYKYRASLS